LSILKVNSCSIDQESGEIWTVQTDLQLIYSKSDSLLYGYENRRVVVIIPLHSLSFPQKKPRI